MSETKIKICGMMREEDILAVNKYRPEFAGFILAKGFRRTVDTGTAGHLRQILDPGITPVGVFVNSPPEDIVEAVGTHIIDMIQLHGDEDNQYIDNLRYKLKRAGTGETPIMKAIKIRNASDAQSAEEISADLVLLDAGTGGGKVFDWHLVLQVKRKYFLAGGLNPENIQKALETVHPFGVDVSSGVETDGHKDGEKIREFIQKVRNFDG